MTALAEKLTFEDMVQHPEKWENFVLYRGEPIEITYSRPNHGKALGDLFFLITSWIRSVGYGLVILGANREFNSGKTLAIPLIQDGRETISTKKKFPQSPNP